jgi:hypothetical protein
MLVNLIHIIFFFTYNAINLLATVNIKKIRTKARRCPQNTAPDKTSHNSMPREGNELKTGEDSSAPKEGGRDM